MAKADTRTPSRLRFRLPSSRASGQHCEDMFVRERAPAQVARKIYLPSQPVVMEQSEKESDLGYDYRDLVWIGNVRDDRAELYGTTPHSQKHGI